MITVRIVREGNQSAWDYLQEIAREHDAIVHQDDIIIEIDQMDLFNLLKGLSDPDGLYKFYSN